MMKNFNFFRVFVATSCFALGSSALALPTAPVHVYPSGVAAALQIGSDLYDSLDAKYRNKLEEHPICAEPTETPAMALVKTNDQNKTLGQISISIGFVDLVNHIAHAKAIDRTEPGYFDKYMGALAQQTTPGTEAPAIVENRYWTDAVMNDQSSYFNQIMGMTMAINLSHQYLGRVDKYSTQMHPDRLVPINNFLTTDEWEKGVRAGAVNSLNCAMGTEGAKALFDAIGKMPHRPAWTAYFVPQNTDIKRLNKQLAKYEVDFFHGGLN